MLTRKYELRSPDGEGSGGGAGGTGAAQGTGTATGTAGAASNGGGGPTLTAGGGNAQAGANNQTTSAGNAGAGGGQAGGSPDWKSTLPTELQTEPSLKLFTNIGDLAKSYLNAQKMIGADKVVVPGKHATDDDWKGVFQKLGLPQDIKEYGVNMKEGVTVDKEFVNAFKETAFKMGILPKQAQGLADWFSEINSKSETKILEESVKAQQTRLGALKTEWGQAYDQRIRGAQQVITELASPELVKFLNDTGLTAEPHLIKIFSDIHAKYFREGTERGGGTNSAPVMTPKEAQGEISKIMGNSQHPYYDKDHPSHKAAVDEVRQLYNLINPSQSPVDKTM